MPLTPSRESALSVRRTTADDPLARPLLDELAHEYTTRYGSAHDLSRYPAEEFALRTAPSCSFWNRAGPSRAAPTVATTTAPPS